MISKLRPAAIAATSLMPASAATKSAASKLGNPRPINLDLSLT